MAKKKRSVKQIAATKRLVAFNKSKKGKKRGPGRPRGSRLARKIAGVGGLGYHGKSHINRSRIAHADSVDKAHGLKPTSFLVKMLEKAPKHIVELQRTVAQRLASDARPGAGRKKATKKAKRAKHRKVGRPAKKHSGGRKRGPGRPKGSKNKKSYAKKAKRGPGRPRKHAKHAKPARSGKRRSPAQRAWAKKLGAMQRAKGEKSRLKRQIKEGKKRHKTAHKKSNWRATTPGFAGVSILG